MRNSNNKLEIHVLDAGENRERAEKVWHKVQSQARHSFFTSWGWIGTWLASLPVAIKPKILFGSDGDKPVVCGIQVERSESRFGLVSRTCAYLNATGNPELDALTIEYNGILSAESSYSLADLVSDPALSHIDEFHLFGIEDDDITAKAGGSFVVARNVRRPSFYVDLDHIRANGLDYLAMLSANRRRQIRKSQRDLGDVGELSVRESTSCDEALQMLDTLAEFHQAEWESRGEPGAFATRYFRDFHRALIRERFDREEIQLLMISAGNLPVGYLYNFVYDGQVLFYQSGFNYEKTRKFRPGVISHYLAIEHNLAKGFERYNFLAGDAQYKKSMATASDTLYWVVIARNGLFARTENFLRRLKRSLVNLLGS